MSGDGWRRVTRDRPCLVCGKPDWCCRTADGAAACCMRVESPKPLRNGGWLHRLDDGQNERTRPAARRMPAVTPTGTGRDWDALAESCRRRVDANALAGLARGLGVAADALTRLTVGWDGAAWAFPMKDAAGRVVGIRRRFPNGRKLSVKGGREGLFVPTDLPAAGLLLICEGPTDCAALLSLGLACIGRPSCTGGVKLVCETARGRDAAIVADGDAPGHRGAATLAGALRLYCPTVRVLTPPAGVKDAREWLRRGATPADVLAAIDAAEILKLRVEANGRPRNGRPRAKAWE